MIGLWTQLKGFIYRLVIEILQFFRWFFRFIFYIISWFFRSIFYIISWFYRSIFQFFRWFYRSIFYIIEWISNIIRQFFLKIKDTLFHVIMLIFVSLCAHFLIYGNCGCIGIWFNDLVRKIVRKPSQFCRFILSFRIVRPFSGPRYIVRSGLVYRDEAGRSLFYSNSYRDAGSRSLESSARTHNA
jgi:hypothetical protein